MAVDFEDSKLGRPSAVSGALSRSGLPAGWAFSTVSKFGSRSNQPPTELSTTHSVEALVEGSDMSRLREGMLCLYDETIVLTLFF
jgi:hypothetical protein